MPRATGIVKRTRKKKARKPPKAFHDSTSEQKEAESPEPTKLQGHSSLGRALDYKTRNLEEQNRQLQDRIDFLEARVRNNTKSALKLENAELLRRNGQLEEQLQSLVREYESERQALVYEMEQVRDFHQANQFEARLENAIERENACVVLCLQMKEAIKHNTARAESKKLYGLLREILDRRQQEEPESMELKAPPRVEKAKEVIVLEPQEPEFRFKRGDHVHVFWKKRKTWMEDGTVMNCDWENGRVYVQYNDGMKTRWMLEQSKFIRFPYEAPPKPPPRSPTPSPSPSPEPIIPYKGPYPEGTQLRVYEKHRKQWHKDGLVEDTRVDTKGNSMVYVTFGGGMKFNWFKDNSKWIMKEKLWNDKYGKEDDVALYMQHVQATKKMVASGPKSVREEYYERIKDVFKKWHKESVPHVDTFLEQHAGQEHELYMQLCTKFNLFPREQYFGPEDDYDPI